MLTGHGDNGYMYAGKVVDDFSSNVWYGKEPSGLREHLFHHWEQINRYPEVASEKLTGQIAKYHGLAADRVLVTAGTTESIYLIAQLYRNSRSTHIFSPAFSEYEDACRNQDHVLFFPSWDDLPAEVSDASLIWITHPNNPTGAVFPGIAPWIEAQPRARIIVDEAFIEFTDSIASLIPLLDRLPNLIVLRSLTKAFAIPGLRLGYIVAGKETISKLRTLKMPWTVSSMAMEAGMFIFGRYPQEGALLPLAALLPETARLSERLRELGFEVYPGHTHFLLCKTPYGTAASLQSWLIDHHGILIRNAANFRGLTPAHFRIACLTPEQNDRLIDALKEFPR